MKGKQTFIGLLSLAMVPLAACGDTQTFETPEVQTSGTETFESTELQESEADTFKTADLQAPESDPYEIGKISVYRNPDSGYEIDDMLPNPPIRIMSVEEAEAFMNNRQSKDSEADTITDAGEETALIVYFSRADNMVFDEDVDAVTSASVTLDELGAPVLDEAGNPIGNMRQLAEYFREETRAEIFSIQTVETYPTGSIDRTDPSAEEKDADARPALSTHVENMDDYDVIYLGYPVCWETLPMPVASFLEEYDFSGKTIIPFTSYGNSGFGLGVSMIKELCPEAEVLNGFAIRDSQVNTDEAKEKVAEFIAGL